MTKVERTYYPDGTIKSEVALAGGLPNGVTRRWYETGVMAEEIPMTAGVIDGVARQWDGRGQLLGESEVRAGTGVYRRWWPSGSLMSETSMVGGLWTGLHRAYSEDGQIVAEEYYLRNKRVSRRRYVQTCREDLSLPRYEDKVSPATRGTERSYASSIAEVERKRLAGADRELAALLKGPDVREAMSWLNKTREPGRSLGEATGQDDSLRLVKKLYSLGAVGVHAIEIDGGPNEMQNAGKLILELPTDPRKRRKLFRYCGVLAQRIGYEPTPDVGQRYALVMLD